MANISSINLPDGSSYNFKDSVSGYISNTGVYGIYYGTCSTAAGTAAKVATLTNSDGFSLTTGVTVAIKFTNANGIASPTLNVNSTGAKSIKRYGTTAPSTSAATSWNAGSVVLLIFDGTNWVIAGWLNSTYSEISVANITNGSSSTTGLVTGRRAKSAVEAFAPVKSVNGSTGTVTIDVPSVSWTQDVTTGTKIASITIDDTTTDVYAPSGGMSRESDPVFTASPAYGITSTDISNWNSAEANVNADWNATSGDAQILNKPTIPTKTSDLTNDSGFITSFTETDPVFTASPAHGITANDIANWNAAEANVNADWNATSGDAEILNKPTIPSKTSDLTNDSGFITANDIPDEVFTAEFNITTYEELLAAYNSGKTMLLNINGNHFAPLVYWDTTNGFVFINQDSGTQSRYHCYSNGNWTNNYSYFVPTSRKINQKLLNADVTLTASDVGVSWSQLQTTGVKIATIGLNGETTDVYAPTSGGTITETDPVFTASPAYGITQSNIDYWNSLPSLITILETGKNAYILSVNGSTATLIDYSSGNAASFLTVFLDYTNIQDCFFGQVINGASDIQQAQARLYELAELDMTTQSVRLVSVDNGVIYTADLQDTGNGLTGTFSSQTIPTGGITTETDPTVPAWAKASTKPSYTASEVGALATSGGQLTGDLTLYVASGNSPGLIFQRGTLTDNYNDWKIYDKGGYLYFAQRGSGSSSFNDMGYIDTSGVLRSFTIPWGSVSGKPTIPTKTSDLTNDSGYLTEPTMNTSTVSSGGSGTWRYRTWPSGWQEAWYQGSIQFTAAASSAGGWYRSTKNFDLPIAFADDASILVSGATSGRVFTHGGIKTSGTQFEAQILGGAALAANTYSGWNVYVAGYGR